MLSSISQFPLLLFLLSLLPFSQCLYFYLDADSTKCFLEELPVNTVVVGHYMAEEWDKENQKFQVQDDLGIMVVVKVRRTMSEPVSYERRQEMKTRDWETGAEIQVVVGIEIGGFSSVVLPTLSPPSLSLSLSLSSLQSLSLSIASHFPFHPSLSQTVHNDHVLTSTRGPSEGKFAFTSHEAGDHQICLSTDYSSSRGSAPQVRMHLDIIIGDAKPDNSGRDRAHITDLASRVRDLNAKLRDIRKEQQFQRERESEFRNLSEQTNSRAVWWSAIQLVTLVGTCVWQLRNLRVSPEKRIEEMLQGINVISRLDESFLSFESFSLEDFSSHLSPTSRSVTSYLLSPHRDSSKTKNFVNSKSSWISLIFQSQVSFHPLFYRCFSLHLQVLLFRPPSPSTLASLVLFLISKNQRWLCFSALPKF